jgi:HEAT repeat protein
MWSRERVDELVALAIGGHAIGGPSAFASVLHAMGKQGVAAAVGAYLRSPPPELKTALDKYLSENAVRDPEAVRRLVQPDVAPELAKSALFIASKSIKGSVAEALYDTAREHPAKLVSDYANFLWRTNTPRGRLKAFQDALGAQDPAERVRAADTLAKAKDTQALEPLIRFVDEASFVSRTPEERKAFLNALVAIGGRPAAECLKRLTERKASLFNRGAIETLRAEATRALADLRKLAASSAGRVGPPSGRLGPPSGGPA